MKYQNTDLSNSCDESEWLFENWLSEVIPLAKATNIESMKATRVYLFQDTKIREYQGKPITPEVTIELCDKTIVRRDIGLTNVSEQELEPSAKLRLKYRLFKDYHHIIYAFDGLIQLFIDNRLFIWL